MDRTEAGTFNDVELVQSSNIKKHFKLSFEDISYSGIYFDYNLYSLKTKDILFSLSGVFESKELSIILGPSGSGKSILLDILSGYKSIKKNSNGFVKLNEIEVCSQNILKKESCYIMQDTLLQELLTVQESLSMAAHLKLDTYPDPVKHAKVDQIVQYLSLTTCRGTLIGNLSGGERKKLSIALELLSDPSIIFLDEPTTGLDYSNAKQLLKLLQNLAHQGTMVICSIHQPSASLLDMVDYLYVMNNGHCTYQGSVPGLIPYLADLTYFCPPSYNPADFILEVSMEADKIHEVCSNGKLYNSNSSYEGSTKLRSIEVKGVRTKEFCSKLMNPKNETHAKNFTEFKILLQRSLLKNFRDRFLTRVRLSLHLIIGSLLGVVYRGIGNDAARVHNNMSLLFFSAMFLMFTAMSSMLITYPLEFHITRREYFNKWYSLRSYYLATMVTDIPIQVLCTIIYCVAVYFISMQPLEMWRFFMFLWIFIFLTLYSQGMGVLVGMILNVKHGVIFGPLTLLPWTIFSGYFILKRDAPDCFKFLFEASFLRYALEGVMLSVYGYERKNLDCDEPYCHFQSPSKFLDALDMKNGDYTVSLMFLIISYVAIKLSAFGVLCFQINRKQ